MPINSTSPRPHVMLVGVTGSVKIMLRGGGTITGTVDATKLSQNIVIITDATPTTWVIGLDNIVAVGQ